MIGGLLAAGGPAYKKPRTGTYVHQDGSPFSQLMGMTKKLVAANEEGEARRARAYKVRLHAAKYLKCDPLLKDMFYPIFTIGKRFGFTSTTGLGALTALGHNNTRDPADVQTWSKANGCWRGLSVFTVRSNAAPSADRMSAEPKLHGKSKIVDGQTLSLYSNYKRFCNGPNLENNQRTAAEVAQNKAQTVNYAIDDDDAEFNTSKILVGEVGTLLDVQNKAINGSPFAGSLNQGGSAALREQEYTAPSTVTSSANGYYWPSLRTSTVRIADGYLEMDITNGKSCSTLIEIVIHAHRKHDIDVKTQELFDAIYKAVDFQQRDPKPYNDTTPLENNPPGGWQAFYDPAYPLLGVKSKFKKGVDLIARETHRSAHMLSPGQTKLIKIELGSLYFDFASQAENQDVSGSEETQGYMAVPDLGAGALMISVGHSGVQQLTAPTITNTTDFWNKPDTLTGASGDATHTVPGAGFWVGKQYAPSEIVVAGNYVEKFYPTYVLSKERRNITDNVPNAPYVVNSGGGYRATLPCGLPVNSVLGTVDATEAVPANITSSARSEL